MKSSDRDEGQRRRNSVTEALELFRGTEAPATLNAFIAFLYVCENEGLNLKTLSHLCRMQLATGSRVIRALAEPDATGALPPFAGLVEVYQDPEDERGRLVFLTAEGRRLRDRIQGVIAAGAPIRAPAELRP